MQCNWSAYVISVERATKVLAMDFDGGGGAPG